MRRRTGFALTIVLWTLVGATGLALLTASIARRSSDSTRNRMESLRSEWALSGCIERALGAASAALWPAGFTASSVSQWWGHLDDLAPGLPAWPHGDCTVQLRPAGLTANLNAVSGANLRRMLSWSGVAPRAADSIAEAVLDWRDADGDARPDGAERQWYVSHGRPPPRDSAFATAAELQLVRGLEDRPDLRAMFDVNPDRVLWTRAPVAVLATLPGLSDEALEVLVARRDVVTFLPALATMPELPDGARHELDRQMATLIPSITDSPEAWIVTAWTTGKSARWMEVRIVLVEQRLVVTRRLVQP